MAKKTLKKPLNKLTAEAKLAEAVGEYLSTVGWKVIVVGQKSVAKVIGSQQFLYEFVVRFTGCQVPEREEHVQE